MELVSRVSHVRIHLSVPKLGVILMVDLWPCAAVTDDMVDLGHSELSLHCKRLPVAFLGKRHTKQLSTLPEYRHPLRTLKERIQQS
jgi:hypothetical protein